MHKGIYIIGVLFLLLASCTGDKEVRALLDRAEGYLPAEVDSASVLLDSVSPSSLSREDVALYGLLRTMTDAMTGKGVTTDSLIRPTYIYYKEQSGSDENTRRLGRSAFYLARYESARDSTKLAEELYREAIRCSEQVEDWRTCYMAYSYIARLISTSDVPSGIKLCIKAMQLYNKVKDKPSNYIYILHDLCYNYISNQQLDSALYYAQEALALVNEYNVSQECKNDAFKSISSVYYYNGDFKQALYYAQQSMQQNDCVSNFPFAYNLAECYLACDSLKQAEKLLLQLRQSPNYKERYVAYRDLARIALSNHQNSLVEQFTDSACSMLEQMYYNSLSLKSDYYDDLIIQKVREEQLKTEKEQLKFRSICITFGLFIIIYILLMIFRKRIRKLALKRRYTVFAHKSSIKQFTMQRKRYEKKIVQRNKTIEAQETNIKRMQASYIKKTLLYKSLMDGTLNNNNLSKYTLEEMEELLNVYSSDFVTRLKAHCSGITPQQLQLCMLMRFGMSRKQIAAFFFKSEETIRTWQRLIKQTVLDMKDSPLTISEIIENF